MGGSKTGLRLRSNNARNTPSPTASLKNKNLSEKAGKIVKIFCDNDENSNPPFENREPQKETAKPKTEISQKITRIETASIGIQVNQDDLDFAIEQDAEEHSLQYYKQLAETRLKETEQLSDQLNTTANDLSEMTKVNT